MKSKVKTRPDMVRKSGGVHIDVFQYMKRKMKENVNKLNFKCTDFNSSACVTVYAECTYVLTEYLKYLSIRRQNLILVTT